MCYRRGRREGLRVAAAPRLLVFADHQAQEDGLPSSTQSPRPLLGNQTLPDAICQPQRTRAPGLCRMCRYFRDSSFTPPPASGVPAPRSPPPVPPSDVQMLFSHTGGALTLAGKLPVF